MLLQFLFFFNKFLPLLTSNFVLSLTAPTTSPLLVRANKQDSSHFVVSWQPIPRDKANGPITKYELTWTLVMQGGKVTMISNAKEINSTASSATLDNLITCAMYNISVRGYTSAGPGPHSKPLSFYTTGK
jgi:hypothetical protein